MFAIKPVTPRGTAGEFLLGEGNKDVRARVIWAVGIGMAVLAAVSGCGTVQDKESQARAYVTESYAQASEGVRLALPVALPTDYQLDRFWSVANVYDEQGDASSVARSAEFIGTSDTVRVCVEDVDIPGTLCPKSNVDITYEADGLRRTVTVESNSWAVKSSKADPTESVKTAVAAVWGDDVTYSDSVGDWTWLS